MVGQGKSQPKKSPSHVATGHRFSQSPLLASPMKLAALSFDVSQSLQLSHRLFVAFNSQLSQSFALVLG